MILANSLLKTNKEVCFFFFPPKTFIVKLRNTICHGKQKGSKKELFGYADKSFSLFVAAKRNSLMFLPV